MNLRNLTPAITLALLAAAAVPAIIGHGTCRANLSRPALAGPAGDGDKAEPPAGPGVRQRSTAGSDIRRSAAV